MGICRKIGETSIGTKELLENHPPVYGNPFKKKIYTKARDLYLSRHAADASAPEIFISRYKPDDMVVSGASRQAMDVQSVRGFFGYEQPKDRGTVAWYMNYADRNLFIAYASDLFAQDEIQCLEHPLLGCVKEYLRNVRQKGLEPLTEQEEVPTPVLIQNVPYWIHVDTSPKDKKGNTHSIYGRMFSNASETLLEKGITVRDAESRSNILAMSAPPVYGVRAGSKYTKATIHKIMRTLLTGFGAAVQQAHETCGKAAKVEIHTGRFGCGAFGNSEALMLLSQLVAAYKAGVDSIVFHSVNESLLEGAKRLADGLYMSEMEEIIEIILDQGYLWGESDGN